MLNTVDALHLGGVAAVDEEQLRRTVLRILSVLLLADLVKLDIKIPCEN
jgi:hypothetical protein